MLTPFREEGSQSKQPPLALFGSLPSTVATRCFAERAILYCFDLRREFVEEHVAHVLLRCMCTEHHWLWGFRAEQVCCLSAGLV